MYLVAIGLAVNLAVGSVCFADSEITGKLKGTIEKVIAIIKDENLKNE